MNKKRSKIQKAIVVYLDLYGFSALVTQASEEERIETVFNAYEQCAENIKGILRGEDFYPNNSYFLSDSIFLIFPVASSKELCNRLRCCKGAIGKILDLFVAVGLPVRGGIAYGDVLCGRNALMGKAVIRAVRHESMAPLPAILLPWKETISCEGTKYESDKKNNISLKSVDGQSAVMNAELILPQDSNAFLRLVSEHMEKTLLHGPYNVAASWCTIFDYLVNTYSSRRRKKK